MIILPEGEIVLKGKFIDRRVDFYWQFLEEQLDNYVLKLVKLKDCVRQTN
jgi:hypothetical protein